MPYTVKEIFYTLQGEGLQSGRPAVFCRFSGCNLWNGKNKDRMNATCQFCDTDFVGTDGPGGGRFEHAHTLVEALRTHWPKPDQPSKFVVLTGGEPLLQVDAPLLKALSKADFEIAVETNGTQKAPEGIDHLCVSPKTAELKQNHGTELKLVFPQSDLGPETFGHLDFDYFFLQPKDGPHREENTQKALEYCRRHPKWRLSLQTHKLLNIP